jgi:transcriptional regulator with PAS, ATPase and Fis domain
MELSVEQGASLNAGVASPVITSISPQELVGESEAFKKIKQIAASIANRRATVMILGETGSGKEMVARYIHQVSNRADQPFVPVDCTALTEGLFESELFGHVKGAFTGALRDSLGFARAASGGTLFLDEIGELGLGLQAKLLRMIQERAVVPVGSQRAIPVDIRIITATNRNIAEMVRKGTFREDLYFRLNVVPPLRQRPDDIVPLANHFLQRQADFYGEPARVLSAEAQALLQKYHWPGNVRELANVMEYAHVLAQGPTVEVSDLPPTLVAKPQPAMQQFSDLRLKELEKNAITEALRRTKNNKAAASRLLGINVHRLSRRIEKLGIKIGG